MDQTLELRDLPKHQHYRVAYKRFDYFWGLGVEHETYLKSSQTKELRGTFEGAMKPERYSVNYYAVYKKEELGAVLKKILDASGGRLVLPILVNSHSLTHCDLYGAHRTTYEKVPKPNPKYAGKTLFEWVCEKSAWCKENYERGFSWDGDTVEFVTQGFYKATVRGVLEELREVTSRFEKELQRLPRQGILVGYGPLSLAIPVNEPFAYHLTNLQNVAMFNNGTLHINLTLPTRLGWNRKPLCWRSFKRQHKRLARCIQWLEPFLIAVYGSGDPLAAVDDRYARGSQRLAVSRYIGVGTFDTHTMPTGKILQVDRSGKAFPWYDRLYQRTNYVALDKVGLDLNFNKHGAHGLELRFFDQMPYDKLEEVIRRLVLLMDYSLAAPKLPVPTGADFWQNSVVEGILEGLAWRVPVETCYALFRLFHLKVDVPKEPVPVAEMLVMLFKSMEPYKGICCKNFQTPK